jgi:heat-inducible transcriptional repressor
MTEELTERSRHILEAIIDDYIESGDPVGSRTVVRRHNLSLSPATIRNVMADLEELGFLASPHTSAGRIPTEKGYRYYLDCLLQIRDLTRNEKRRIDAQCHSDGDLEHLLQETGKALSTLSNYAGIVMAPRFNTTVFRQIEFVRLSSGRILVIFVSQSGQVQNKLIESDPSLTQSDLEQITNYLNQTLSGLSIGEMRQRIAHEMQQEKALYDTLTRRALELSGAALEDDSAGKVFIEGASSFLDQPEFSDVEHMKRLFRAFEQKSTLIELLDRSQQAAGVQIFIGSQNNLSQIEGCSLVTASYRNQHGTIGTLGVIGPNRMPYSKVIPIVDYTARMISRLLETGHSKET